MELIIIGCIYIFGFILAGLFVIGSKIAQKYPQSKLSKLWYKN